MPFRAVVAIVAVVVLSAVSPAPPARAAEPEPTLEELLRRIEALERTVREQQRVIEALTAAPEPAAAPEAAAEPSDLEAELARELGAAPAPEPPASGPAPIVLASGAGGKNYLNLSVDGLFVVGGSSEDDLGTLYAGGHDPVERGFGVQNVEVVLEGAVDPYFKGQANLIFRLDENGETEVELEEVYATTTALPGNLQVKAGHFFSEFGRLNPTHPHTWDFVSQPLVNSRMFGGDGLRNPGVRVSWLMPTPFYSELFLAVQNAGGETAPSFRSVAGEEAFGRPLVERPVRSAGDLLYVPRWAASFDLSDTWTVLFGASGAFGPNATGPEGRTRIVGADMSWKWKPIDADRGFPFVRIQAEGMTRSYEADASPGFAAATFEDRGGYAQVVWGIRPRWLVGARWDRVFGDAGDAPDDPVLVSRRRIGANLTWFPSEYSKLRLQYDRDRRDVHGDADSLWLQFEFLLGAHAAHKF